MFSVDSPLLVDKPMGKPEVTEVKDPPEIWGVPNTGSPQIIHFRRIFYHKPSILGDPHSLENLHLGVQQLTFPESHLPLDPL